MDVFPSNFNLHIDKESNQELSTEHEKMRRKQTKLETKIEHKHTSGNISRAFAKASPGLSLLVAIVTTILNNSLSTGLTLGVISFFCVLLCGFLIDLLLTILLCIISICAKNKSKNKEKEYEQKAAELRSKSDEYKREYAELFEKTVKQESVRFSTSDQTQRIIGWMIDGYFRNIDASDRRSHISKIIVPFKFDVYLNKVVCADSIFDFELKRLKPLNNVVEQAALARAIASDIHLKIELKYPKDVSGTPINIRMEHQYFNDYIQYTIVYEADNGFYKEATGW